MAVKNPAVKRRSQCALWLSSRCHYSGNCQCLAAEQADATKPHETRILPARRSK